MKLPDNLNENVSKDIIPTRRVAGQLEAALERKARYPYKFPRDGRPLGGQFTVKENARRLLRYFYFERRLMQALGAEGVALAWEHVYNALRAGLVDGAENSIGALVIGRHGEVVKYYSFDEHTMVPDVFLCAAARWASFSPAQQQFVRAAARVSHRRMNELWETFETDMRAKVEAMGVTFTYPDKAPFIARASALTKEFADDPELKMLIGRIAQS